MNLTLGTFTCYSSNNRKKKADKWCVILENRCRNLQTSISKKKYKYYGEFLQLIWPEQALVYSCAAVKWTPSVVQNKACRECRCLICPAGFINLLPLKYQPRWQHSVRLPTCVHMYSVLHNPNSCHFCAKAKKTNIFLRIHRIPITATHNDIILRDRCHWLAQTLLCFVVWCLRPTHVVRLWHTPVPQVETNLHLCTGDTQALASECVGTCN